MTLARRLALALVALLIALVTAGTAVVMTQRHYLLEQLDTRLASLTLKPRLLVVNSRRIGIDRVGSDFLGDVYVGRMASDGTLQTVQAPTDDPDLVPAVGPSEHLPTPTGRPVRSGRATQVRVVTAQVATERTFVIAISTAGVDAATRSLVTTLIAAASTVWAVVGLVVWWVYRLGLVPISRMTQAADAITAGATDRRVEPGHPGTEAARLGQALNTMIDVTQAAQQRMRRFVADASHELRTPLTTLRGYSALHATGEIDAPETVQDAMRRIHQEACRMARIVDNLLQLNDLDERGLTHRVEIDLAPRLRDIVADLRVVQPERVIELRTPPSLTAEVDPDQIAQAVMALASNALRHTPVDAPVLLRAEETEGSVRVEVSDGGPGIPSEHLPHLFERFYRADHGRERRRGGSGLGLAIMSSIVTAHGGTHGAASTLGAGSTFWFQVPRDADGERRSLQAGRVPRP